MTVAAARTAGIVALKRKAYREALFVLLEDIQHGSQKDQRVRLARL